VKAWRNKRVAVLWKKTNEQLRDVGVEEPEPPSLKFAIPILEAAADEENEGLQDLWARLLAAAMDPKRRDGMRQAFVETVKHMDPMDALVLGAIPQAKDAAAWSNGLEPLSTAFSCEQDEVRVSFEHLAKLDCIYFVDSTGARVRPYLSPFGNLLTKIVSGEG
jgi:Abortive infection alpha